MQADAADGQLVGSDGAGQLQGADALQRLGLLRGHADGGGEVVAHSGFSHRFVSAAAGDAHPPAPAAALLLLLALGFGWARLGLLAALGPLLPEVDEHLVPERCLVLVVQLPQDGLIGLQVRPELLELLDELVLVLGHLEQCWSEDGTKRPRPTYYQDQREPLKTKARLDIPKKNNSKQNKMLFLHNPSLLLNKKAAFLSIKVPLSFS